MSNTAYPKPDFDVVFLRGLSVTASVGPDTWHRPNRVQPVILDIRMRTNIQLCGETDDVLKTIHYGNLSKAVTNSIEKMKSYSSLKQFAQNVCIAAVGPGGGVDTVVELTATLPKGLLLADCIGISTVQEIVIRSGGLIDSTQLGIISESLFVRNMKLACIIGVNPHERLEKQYVVIDLTFFQCEEDIFLNYAKTVKQISDGVEMSSYQTLESLATFIGQIACSSSSIGAVTVSVQKPSAIPSVAGSGVEITRDRKFYQDLRNVS